MMGEVQCNCRECVKARGKAAEQWWFIVCKLCGNKRCPHATNHCFQCTRSNAPGQRGSIYERAALSKAGTE